MSPDNPIVTVYSLCYNTGKYVVEGLESFKACNVEDYQLVVIDDCSSDDNSANMVEEWLRVNEPQAVFIRHAENQGICKSLNEVLRLTKGKYLTGICDDMWEKGRLDEEIPFLEANGTYGMVFCNAKIIDKDSKLTGDTYGDPSVFTRIDEKGNYLEELLKGNFIVPPACVYRTSALRDLGGYDESLSFEDWDMYLRFAKNNIGIKYLNHSRMWYRMHAASFWQSRSYVLLTSLIQLFEKHDILDKNDSLVSYLEHFSSISWRNKFRFTFSLLKKFKIKLAAVSVLNSINAPLPFRYRMYRMLFNPINHR